MNVQVHVFSMSFSLRFSNKLLIIDFHFPFQIFVSNDPSSLYFSLQNKSRIFFNFVQILGLRTVIDYCRPINEMLLSAIAKSKADDKGNFIERNLAEIELHKDDEGSCFHDETGFMHMKGMLMDLFVAGTLKIKTQLLCDKIVRDAKYSM